MTTPPRTTDRQDRVMVHDEGDDPPPPTGFEMFCIIGFAVGVMVWWAVSLPFRPSLWRRR